ncbi:MAG: 4Fe-4S dicluster domain-containing protein, partial [Candidatus Odinarchaeota archaeon]
PFLQSIEERKKIERYVNCILCAICYSSCPVNAINRQYIGPAALAKSFRFSEDSRVTNPTRYIEAAKSVDGAPLCDLIMNCVKSCPKGVTPGGAIRQIKSR